MDKELKEMHECMTHNYKQDVEIAIEQVLCMEFPKIKNLNVKHTGNNNIAITFNEGDYTKEEVESRLNEIKKELTK